jgi:hypothetical protein
MPNIIVCGVRRFDREDGKTLGAPGRIVLATDGEIAEAETKRERGRVSSGTSPCSRCIVMPAA